MGSNHYPIKLTLLFLLVGFHCQLSNGEKLHKLENLLETLTSSFFALKDTILNMLTEMKESTSLTILIDKSIEYINAGNEVGVNKVWEDIVKDHNDTTADILNNIVINSYGGKRQNIPALIRFITQTDICWGYETLFNEMGDYGHYFDGGEIFSLAYSIQVHCNQSLFEKMPPTVQMILTKNVSLQNTFNKGFLYRKHGVKDSVLVENHIATLKTTNISDFWRFEPADEFADTFVIRYRHLNLVSSLSRRIYFSVHSSSKFALEMNDKEEITFGMELDGNQGRKFYRLYVQKNKIRRGESFEVNLWTINPGDEYYKYIYWIAKEQPTDEQPSK